MGKSGPPRTPLRILANRGSEQKVKARANTIQIEAGIPNCPDWLQGDARLKWFELVTILGNLGVLTKADGDTLSRYCSCWALWLMCLKDLKDKPKFITSDVKPYLSLAAELDRLGNSFGLNPSARSSIVVGKTTDDKNEKFFKKSG